MIEKHFVVLLKILSSPRQATHLRLLHSFDFQFVRPQFKIYCYLYLPT